MKPCRGPLFPANYVETSKTIKHLVVFLPHFNFSQYCDRGKHCAFPRVVAVKRSKSKGQGRANRWIYNFLFIYSFPIVSLETLPSGLYFWTTILTALCLNTFFLNTTQTARPLCVLFFSFPTCIQEAKSKFELSAKSSGEKKVQDEV